MTLLHPIHKQLADFNARAESLTDRLRRAKPSDVEAIQQERGALNAEAKAAGFVRLFDNRFRLSGAQVLQVEASSNVVRTYR